MKFRRSNEGHPETDAQQKLKTALKLVGKTTENLQAPERVKEALLHEFRKPTQKRMKAHATFLKAAAILFCVSIIAGVVYRARIDRPRATTQKPAATETKAVSSEFIPLLHGEIPSNSVQVVRVKLPRSSLLEFGLPVNWERADEMIDAEVIVGDEGLPHAIRFIQPSKEINPEEEK